MGFAGIHDCDFPRGEVASIWMGHGLSSIVLYDAKSAAVLCLVAAMVAEAVWHDGIWNILSVGEGLGAVEFVGWQLCGG